MSSIVQFSLDEARRLALAGHGLGDGAHLPQGSRAVVGVVEQLGYVQIDTIAVVERAHHHTIWSRYGAYRHEMLDALLARDRLLFEYWHHAACYLPMRDYRYSLAQMHAFDQSAQARAWFADNASLVELVLGRISDEGGLRSSDFEAPPGHVRAGWWARKPAKVALEMLLSRGDLMISAREGFQRRYDLRERVLPTWVDQSAPDRHEIGRHLVLQNLRRMGLAQPRDLTLPRMHRTDAAQALQALVKTGEVTPVQVEGQEQPYYSLAGALPPPTDGDDAAHLLSPFDPLVIQRAWLRRLFGFDYSLECYLPAAKRVYGYYSLPILWRQRFVGRVDAKADRQDGVFRLRRLVFEQPYELSADPMAAMAAAIWRYAAFAGCGEVAIEAVDPPAAAAALRLALEAGHDG